MKHLRYLVFLLSVCGLAQSITLNSSGTISTSTPQETFDAAYWASQPTAIQAAHSSGTLSSQCLSLANQGYLIDEWIMCWANDAYWAQTIRAQLGYTWVPSLLQPPIGANPGYAEPGLQPQPGQSAYPTVPPPNTILVSTALSSYPAYSAPNSTPAPTTPTFSVGPQVGSGLYMLISNTGVSPTLGATLTLGSVSGTVVKVGPFAYGLQVAN